MKTQYILFFVLIVTAVSCGTSDFRDIEEYPIKPSALNDGDSVDVIFWSGGPNAEDDQDFYYQYVVVKVNSNDTVRVLSPSNNLIEDDGTGYQYISADTKIPFRKLVLLSGIDVNNIEKIGNVNDIKKVNFPEYKKVFSPNKFKHFENTKYPTVYGIIVMPGNINN